MLVFAYYLAKMCQELFHYKKCQLCKMITLKHASQWYHYSYIKKLDLNLQNETYITSNSCYTIKCVTKSKLRYSTFNRWSDMQISYIVLHIHQYWWKLQKWGENPLKNKYKLISVPNSPCCMLLYRQLQVFSNGKVTKHKKTPYTPHIRAKMLAPPSRRPQGYEEQRRRQNKD